MLGVGIDPNTASWGGMLASQIGYLTALPPAREHLAHEQARGRPQPGRAADGRRGPALLGEQIRAQPDGV